MASNGCEFFMNKPPVENMNRYEIFFGLLRIVTNVKAQNMFPGLKNAKNQLQAY
jgi:hypothetical protein